MPEERRTTRRHAVAYQLTGRALTAVTAGAGRGRPVIQEISGEIPDISAGGLSLLTDDRVEVADALRCEIRAPSLPIGVPTLLNVRWTRPDDGPYTYRLGLQFLV
jgi:hypothetical protein